MRHRNLVFAALFGLFLAFTAPAQDIDFDFGLGPVANRAQKAEPATPQVQGQVTDFAGRSIRAAEVRFVDMDADEIVSVKTNAFGFYQTADLTPGRSYFVSVHHRKYLFIIVPTEILVGDTTIRIDFQGESAR